MFRPDGKLPHTVFNALPACEGAHRERYRYHRYAPAFRRSRRGNASSMRHAAILGACRIDRCLSPKPSRLSLAPDILLSYRQAHAGAPSARTWPGRSRRWLAASLAEHLALCPPGTNSPHSFCRAAPHLAPGHQGPRKIPLLRRLSCCQHSAWRGAKCSTNADSASRRMALLQPRRQASRCQPMCDRPP